MGAVNKDSVLGASLVLSVVSLVLLFGVTWYFQTSLDLLQQQVLQLQDQVNAKPQKESRIHSAIRRQLTDGCQCKDGLPGPRGPEGRKGEQGLPGQAGQKGDVGEVGPRGPVGDQGFPGMKGRAGEKGNQGDQGFPGLRGIMGYKGSQGETGMKGNPGVKGSQGMNGVNGTDGEKGDMGEKGMTGEKGETGSKGEMGPPGEEGKRGKRGEKGDQGIQGEKGEPGVAGPKGDIGPQGATGAKGDIGVMGKVSVPGTVTPGPGATDVAFGAMLEKSVGTVYVRWGHDDCPSSASLVYTGRAAGAHHHDKGSGANTQCLPLNPTYLSTSSGKDDIFSGRIYGAEYQTHRQLGRRSHQNDIPCAVCYANRSAHFMVPAQHSCPATWTTEYYGYLMSSRHDQHRTEYTCVDSSFKAVPDSATNDDGLLFYTVEPRCGSLPCDKYDETKELTCAVCTK